MSQRDLNILFLCTGNSARSILAECLVNHIIRGPFKAYSAGSMPTGSVNPYTMALLEKWGVPSKGLRSKNWSEFADDNAPSMDFVITVCDQAAGEVCPVWPGQPILAHWGVSDPAKAVGTDEEILSQFVKTATVLRYRIELLFSLPIAKLERFALEQQVKKIGQALP
jgi:protein-tyrosine-phosphatase